MTGGVCSRCTCVKCLFETSMSKWDCLSSPHTQKWRKMWLTVMWLILDELKGYLLPLGVSLTVYSSRVIWQFWWFLKSGQVSALRLKSQKWSKRFFLEGSAVALVLPDSIPCLQFFCIQIPWQAGMAQDPYKDLFYGENLHEIRFIFMPNKYASWSILFHFGSVVKESKFKVYKHAKYVKISCRRWIYSSVPAFNKCKRILPALPAVITEPN